ncbi:MAG: class I SAM-dependent methyltransferase [Pseudomonadota bacterium]
MKKSTTFVCPWWLIHSFDNRLRRLVHSPEQILGGLIKPGDRCLDVGCGFGYFSIPMARLAGPEGSVIAVDLQPKMLEGVRRRARKCGVYSRVHLHEARQTNLQLAGQFDFILCFWMLHEVPDQRAFLAQLVDLLKVDGLFLLAEPKIHVNTAAFRKTVRLAEGIGFRKSGGPQIFFSRTALMGKRPPGAS